MARAQLPPENRRGRPQPPRKMRRATRLHLESIATPLGFVIVALLGRFRNIQTLGPMVLMVTAAAVVVDGLAPAPVTEHREATVLFWFVTALLAGGSMARRGAWQAVTRAVRPASPIRGTLVTTVLVVLGVLAFPEGDARWLAHLAVWLVAGYHAALTGICDTNWTWRHAAMACAGASCVLGAVALPPPAPFAAEIWIVGGVVFVGIAWRTTLVVYGCVLLFVSAVSMLLAPPAVDLHGLARCVGLSAAFTALYAPSIAIVRWSALGDLRRERTYRNRTRARVGPQYYA